MTTSVLERKDFTIGAVRVLARVSFDGKDTDGTPKTFRWAGVHVPDPGAASDDRVISFGYDDRAVSEDDGEVRVNTSRVVLADHDYLLRGFLESVQQYGVINAVAHIEIIKEQDWISGYDWQSYFRGEVASYKPAGGHLFTLELKGWATRRLARKNALPQLDPDFGTRLPPSSRGLCAPLLLGRKSGEGSATAAPTIENETGNGSSGPYVDVGDPTGFVWGTGFGNRGGTIPTSPAAVANVGGGSLEAGTFYVVVTFTPTGGDESEQAPFLSTLSVVVADGDAIDVSCDNMGAGTYRFYFGNDGYRFFAMVESATPAATYDGTNGVTPPALWILVFNVYANMPDGRTALSSHLNAVGCGPRRVLRFAWDPVVGAVSYTVVLRYPGDLSVSGFFWAWDVETTHLQGDGFVYFEWDQLFTTGASLPNGLAQPRGVLPVVHVGTFQDVSGTEWQGFLLTYGTAEYISLYKGTDLVAGELGVSWAVPGLMGFSTYFSSPYVELNGRRYSVFYVKGADADAAIDGSVPITVNAVGIDDVGDDSGARIENGYDQLAWVWDNLIAPDVPQPAVGGDWLGLATFSDSTPKRSTAAWAIAEAEALEVIPDGPDRAYYLPAVAYDTRPTNQDLLRPMLVGLEVGLGWNLLGQAVIVLHPPAPSSVEADEAISHLDEILDDPPFDVEDDETSRVTSLPYTFDYDDMLGSFQGSDEQTADAAKSAYGDEEKPGAPLELLTVTNASIAAAISQRYQKRHQRPQRTVTFGRAFHAIHRDLGSRPSVTHPEGIGVGGYVDRLLQVKRVRPDLDRQIVVFDFWDLSWVDPSVHGDVALAAAAAGLTGAGTLTDRGDAAVAAAAAGLSGNAGADIDENKYWRDGAGVPQIQIGLPDAGETKYWIDGDAYDGIV